MSNITASVQPEPRASAAFALLSVACLTIMVGCVLVPGLPDIASHLGITQYTSGLVTVPSLGVVILGPLAGWSISRLGLRRSLCIGLFFYGLLGVAGAWLHGSALVFADRFLLGGATAVVMTAGTGLISALYQGKRRMDMIARQGMSIELGGVIFLAFAGVLASIGWRWPFALYLLAWVLLAWVLACVPPVAEEPASTAQSAQGAMPGPLKVIYFAAVFSMVLFFTGVISLPYSLQHIGVSAEHIGYFLSFVSLVAVGAAAGMPAITSHLGGMRVLVLSFLCYAVAHGIFSMASDMAVFILGGVFMGSGFGFSVPLLNHMAVEQSPAPERGRYLAYLSMAIFFGQFASSFMEYVPGDIARVFAAAAVMALLVAGALFALHRNMYIKIGR